MIAKILITFLVVWFIARVVIFTNNKFYCYLFEHKDWNLWKTVLGKLEGSDFIEHYESEMKPYLENYKFGFTLDDGAKCKLIYWVQQGVCSVHNEEEDECLLCDFDRYHSNMAVDMVRERLGL